MVVKDYKDFEEISQSINAYDIIEINFNYIKKSLFSRSLIKHSFWALNKGGTLKIKFDGFRGFGYKKNCIRFWQIRSEFFKVINSSEYSIIQNSIENGLLEIKKKNITKNNNMLSIGFVINNLESEKEFLLKSILNIRTNPSVEIIICGPSKYKNDIFFKNNDLRYLARDIELSNGRILFTIKKNIIFQSASNNLVAICHSRILITKDFINKILNKHFEVATPSIYYLKDGKEFKYLDLLFIDDYDFMKKPKSHTVLSMQQDKIFYKNLANSKTYIDGGICVFNKNYITHDPFPEYLGWGEAEDVEMCSNLFNKGYLIERFFDIKCYTQKNKLIIGESFIDKIIRKFNLNG
jgi:hypothetical protein